MQMSASCTNGLVHKLDALGVIFKFLSKGGWSHSREELAILYRFVAPKIAAYSNYVSNRTQMDACRCFTFNRKGLEENHCQ